MKLSIGELVLYENENVLYVVKRIAKIKDKETVVLINGYYAFEANIKYINKCPSSIRRLHE